MTPSLPVRLSRAPAAARRQALEATATLGSVRLALWLLPYKRVQRMFEPHLRSELRPMGDGERTARIAETTAAIRRGARLIPVASCLTQAIATRTMLARRGVPSTLRIGVAKGDDARLQAHAWVEADGEVVVGGQPNLARYAVLPTHDGGARGAPAGRRERM